ncbi:hypothetical protein CH63R_05225 [Colletotrichum higginsianum IMI 349063]|uniref:Uncharacterized protein n=1 Tax=Colletotrichum higginsianum (strain IMI 349063) TaxID=759273 RepID=A0A1B7YLK9_COLHI|nr:hypothetical protein CH63R_05225 [Colletotrichum higginsianum IMI 349063]OBR12929.1 hypothetical protein CH63R_05225 [Colletotrichum higginsianum IMI 349063]
MTDSNVVEEALYQETFVAHPWRRVQVGAGREAVAGSAPRPQIWGARWEENVTGSQIKHPFAYETVPRDFRRQDDESRLMPARWNGLAA